MTSFRNKMKSGISALDVNQTIEFTANRHYKKNGIVDTKTILDLCSESALELEVEARETIVGLRQFGHMANRNYKLRLRINLHETSRDHVTANTSIFVTRSE